MKIGIIGSGMVGQTLGTKFAELGHEVKIGTRDTAKLQDWAAKAGTSASVGSNQEAAQFGEIVFNCTSGKASLEALQQAGETNLNGKILVDVANPLDFTQGVPSLTISNTTSLGEQIQEAFPQAKVVKTLNTINANVMVNPTSLADGQHDIFVCGNDADAKAKVSELLQKELGWTTPIDLGDITAARGTEMYLMIWIKLMGSLKTANFNIKIVK